MKAKRYPDCVGVIQLPALGGSAGARGLSPLDALQRAGKAAVEEARTLVKTGFRGILVENFGDRPFYGSRVPAETISALAIILAAIRDDVRVPLGVRVLRNDVRGALGLAAVTGCDFIRVTLPPGSNAAAELHRERARLGTEVAVFVDAHATEIESLVRIGGVDGVILSPESGVATDESALEIARAAKRRTGASVWIESKSVPGFGVFAGSVLRRGGRAGAKLDPARIRAFLGQRSTYLEPRSTTLSSIHG